MHAMHRTVSVLSRIFFLFLIWVPRAGAGDLFPVAGIMHISSTVSDGQYSVDGLAGRALAKGIEVIFLSDHDLKKWEYGLPPFRGLFKRKVELNSVLSLGPDKYLALIREAEKNNKGIIIIPGVEAAAFYYWKGNILKHNMELQAWHRHILIAGLEKAEDYNNLPLVANGRSRFDQYHGDKWFKPYQDLIDYVNKKGGLAFWAHPEAENKQVAGGILIHTLPYPDFLLKTFNYTGFGILHEGYKEVGVPGGIWDKMLQEYVKGGREKSMAAIGEADYEAGAVEEIDMVKNVFLVKEKTKPAILESLRKGRFYVVKKSKQSDLRLERFELSSGESKAIMGENILTGGKGRISISLSDALGSGQKILVRLIKNGKIIAVQAGDLPMSYDFTDNDLEYGGYYRLDVSAKDSMLLTNPIFFNKYSYGK